MRHHRPSQRVWAISPKVAALLAGGLLASCASAPGSEPVIPSIAVFQSTTQAAPDDDAVALIGVRFADLKCAEIKLVIGESSNETDFQAVSTTSIASQFGNGQDTAVIRLRGGNYSVLQIACRNGSNVTFVGASNETGVIPWQGRSWQRSIAAFGVARGKTADLGMMVLTASKPKGFDQSPERSVKVTLQLRDEPSRARLIKAQPELAAAGLSATPLGLSPAPPLNLVKCKLSADPVAAAVAEATVLPGGADAGSTLNALSVKEPPPASCQPITGSGGLPG
jgi:hypothetical protein